MADIRKRKGKQGTTYQVRYSAPNTSTGYRFKTFRTLKEARAFIESGEAVSSSGSTNEQVRTVSDAVDMWLGICEKEGLNGREPVTAYTYDNYKYRADIIKEYDWSKTLCDLTPPDIVAFRSWLLTGGRSRSLASKVLTSLQSVLKEMAIRGVVTHNPAAGIYVSCESRYDEPVVIPSRSDIVALLHAADTLANSKNRQVARTWERYRPMLYLAADSGMRPQEYLAVSRSAFTDKGVFVQRAIDGSGRQISVTKTAAGRRFIDLSPDTLDMCCHYAKNKAPKSDYDLAFPASNGRWQSRRNWQRRGFNSACRQAGLMDIDVRNGREVEIPKYRPYDLRHFFASRLIETNVNLKKIQTLMGHSNIETTLNVYGHLLEDEHSKPTGKGMLGGLVPSSCGEFVAEEL